MAIISFWNNGTEETGKSSSIVAITTLLGVNHNYKVLVLDTKYNDYFYQDCFYTEDRTIKLINSKDAKTDIGHGISGLSKAILSNKTSPEIVTNYTKIVFTSNRLELLTDTDVDLKEYEIHKTLFKDIARIANKYYDLVFIDIDNSIDEEIVDSLLEISDIVMACLPQKLRQINEYIKLKEEKQVLKGKAIIPIVGRYDKHSKYNVKNISRYIKEKKGVCAIPYNTLFFEACNEGKVSDFFIKFRKINEKDRNALFISDVRQTTEKIISRLQELQMRM